MKGIKMNPETRRQLIADYQNDIELPQTLVNRDLSNWLV